MAGRANVPIESDWVGGFFVTLNGGAKLWADSFEGAANIVTSSPGHVPLTVFDAAYARVDASFGARRGQRAAFRSLAAALRRLDGAISRSRK